MRNIIRKVLKEEFNDLDWIRDAVTDKLIKNENWMLVNDIDRESISEGHEIQKYLFDLGYSWGTGDLKNSLMDFCIYTVYHFGNVKDDDHMYYQDGCRSADIRISDRDIKSGEHMIYYWSDLKPKTIKEEDDFDWVGEADGLRNEKPKKGDIVNVVYVGPRDLPSKNYFLTVLGKYRRDFKLGKFGKNIRGEVTEVGSKGYVLKEINTGYEIYIPSPEHVEKQKEKAKKDLQKRGIPKLNLGYDFEFYHIVEPIGSF